MRRKKSHGPTGGPHGAEHDLVGIPRGELRCVVGLAILVTGVCQDPRCQRWRPATHEVRNAAGRTIKRLCEVHAVGVEGVERRRNQRKIKVLEQMLKRLRLRQKPGGFPVVG